jgi:hypothetical protein
MAGWLAAGVVDDKMQVEGAFSATGILIWKNRPGQYWVVVDRLKAYTNTIPVL